MARVLPSSVVVLSILSAAFPSVCSALFLHYCPKSQRDTNMNHLKGSKCCKTDGKRAFYGLSLLMLSTRAAPFCV